MRLIDADEFLKKLGKEIEGAVERYYENDKDSFYGGICSACGEIRSMISNQPTAYDVDKVVKQLEVLSDRADYDMSVGEKGMCQYYDGFGDGIDKAIEIVKGGGTDATDGSVEESVVYQDFMKRSRN